jgi:hypothetical protein
MAMDKQVGDNSIPNNIHEPSMFILKFQVLKMESLPLD